MDLYIAGLRRLRADTRSCQELQDVTEVPGRTIQDIKSGKASFDGVRLGTARKIAKHYFPKLIAV